MNTLNLLLESKCRLLFVIIIIISDPIRFSDLSVLEIKPNVLLALYIVYLTDILVKSGVSSSNLALMSSLVIFT